MNHPPEVLIGKLCESALGVQNKGSSTKLTQYALNLISSYGEHTIPNISENGLLEKMKLQLSKTNKVDEAAKLGMLHRRLKQSDFLQNRWSVLYLLHSLSNKREEKISGGSLLFRHGLAASSTPVMSNRIGENSTISSSGFGTAAPASSRGLETFSQLPSNISTPGDTQSTNLSSRLGWSLTPSEYSAIRNSTQVKNGISAQQTLEGDHGRKSKHAKSAHLLTKEQVNEANLVRQMLYVFQGIPSKNIKHSTRENAFCLDNNIEVDKRDRQAVHRLCELGWLHNRIKKYIDSHNKDKALGLVGQAFCAALQQELTEYYRLLSVLQSQIQQIDAGFEDNCILTLPKLAVWTFEPYERLKWIAALVDNCEDKKGGALTSMVHAFMQTGDSSSRAITRRILHIVSQPIFHIIDKWICDGELYDPFHEFFVAADLTVRNERLWYDKYRIRQSMIPSFIKMEQAEKILLVGKSINFLRLVCQDRTKLLQDRLQMSTDGAVNEDGYGLDFAADLQVRVRRAHTATGAHLLNVLRDQFKMLTHLHALRKFLLLGQGDFIRHLLDLLQEELSKPANLLYRHNLSGPVEAAVRASNAQFEDADVLTRLDFRLLEINPGDFGWDVFSLDYHLDPPLNTLITPDVMLVYLRIFIFLWRAKRMEYNLALIWTGMMEQSRRLAPVLPHLQSVLHNGHVLAAEMVHFVHQMQYYIAFEVLECSWADFQSKLKAAKDFDEVIAAHHAFLECLMKRCLLDESSSNLLMQLRSIYDQIVKFELLQKDIYQQSTFEMEAREKYDARLKDSENKGVLGMDAEKEEEEIKRRREFRKTTIPGMRARLRVCACAYQDMVVKFLRQLGKESDANLRNLSWRLDFNEHYCSKDSASRYSQSGSRKTGR
ncbi:unnamed protein product [Clavelina lepadiformis]|uniref:Gamma-tubulin complex component n=1 Tax=Clavelina lepadiformis TaxID=159417 RepID=A0ABP0GU59_CLALP